MITVGVARPSAHGQAMTSVAHTQFTACARLPLSAKKYQRQNTAAAMITTMGTNTVAILSASLAIGAFSLCALLTMSIIC